MTPKRFETLADAFGGDVARWPAAEREAAAQLMAAEPAWAGQVLARAGELDAALEAWPPVIASGALADRIAATAPREPRRRTIWLVPAGLGAGLAAACAAGVLLGVQLSAPPPVGDEPGVTAVADDDVGLYAEEAAG